MKLTDIGCRHSLIFLLKKLKVARQYGSVEFSMYTILKSLEETMYGLKKSEESDKVGELFHEAYRDE